jgi:hypothetical protein
MQLAHGFCMLMRQSVLRKGVCVRHRPARRLRGLTGARVAAWCAGVAGGGGRGHPGRVSSAARQGVEEGGQSPHRQRAGAVFQSSFSARRPLGSCHTASHAHMHTKRTRTPNARKHKHQQTQKHAHPHAHVDLYSCDPAMRAWRVCV